jgi:hypothetical protein
MVFVNTLRDFTAKPAPRFVRASPRCFEIDNALIMSVAFTRLKKLTAMSFFYTTIKYYIRASDQAII